jgi:acyl-coenzyme A synthetase/AMP-(fatty) acid ligase
MITVAEHGTGTVKLRARWFSRPALIEEAMIGRPDTAKGIIINVFVFLCITHNQVIG